MVPIERDKEPAPCRVRLGPRRRDEAFGFGGSFWRRPGFPRIMFQTKPLGSELTTRAHSKTVRSLRGDAVRETPRRYPLHNPGPGTTSQRAPDYEKCGIKICRSLVCCSPHPPRNGGFFKTRPLFQTGIIIKGIPSPSGGGQRTSLGWKLWGTPPRGPCATPAPIHVVLSRRRRRRGPNRTQRRCPNRTRQAGCLSHSNGTTTSRCRVRCGIAFPDAFGGDLVFYFANCWHP